MWAFLLRKKAVLLENVWNFPFISHKLHCWSPHRGCCPLKNFKFTQIFPRMPLFSHQLDLFEFILFAGTILCISLKMSTVKMLKALNISVMRLPSLRTSCSHSCICSVSVHKQLVYYCLFPVVIQYTKLCIALFISLA